MEKPEISDHSGLSGSPVKVFPVRNSKALARFLKQNPGQKFRIGAGLTAIHGAAVPKKNEIFIDMSGFRKLEWFDDEAGIIIAEAGATMKAIRDFAAASGWCMPVLPGSLEKASIGGMIACNGGGPLSLKFGKIAAFVLGMEVVLPSGKSHFSGGYATKISEGIDSKSIWIGSEGTLGIITHVVIRCKATLPEMIYYRFCSGNYFSLLKMVPALVQNDASLIEAAEEAALRFSSGASCHVLWAAFERAPRLSLPDGIQMEVVGPESMEERFQIGYGLQHYKPFLDLDVCFPLKTVVPALMEIRELFNQAALEHIFFGHAGDGNHHIHLFFNEDVAVWKQIAPRFDRLVKKHLGHISGEHGIGKIHASRFRKWMPETAKKMYCSLKQEFDPLSQLPSLF